MKMSLVIPCFNEADNLPGLLSRFHESTAREDVELILVDNGSTDNTSETLANLLEGNTKARAVQVPVNNGYGHGILSGLDAAQGEFLGWTHADMQTDPGDAIKALELLEKNNAPEHTFAKGNRRNRPLSDSLFTAGMSLFESLYLGIYLFDINAQPTVFHRSFYNCWQNPPRDFSLDLFAYYTARRRNLEIIRFPVNFPPRQHGESKWNTGLVSKWKFIRRTLDYSITLKKGL